MDAKERIAQDEGLLVEAASAAPFAALPKLKLPREAVVVCIATGNGLKDLSDHGGERSIETAEGSDAIAKSIVGGNSKPHQ